MTLRQYLLIMTLMTAFCWLVFGYVVFTVNPEITNNAGFGLFYFSLFASLVGSAALVGFLIRFVFLRHELIGRTVKIAFRQSFMFAFFIIAVLFLQERGLLSWLNALILIIGLSALEFFLLSYGKNTTDVIARSDSDEAIPGSTSKNNIINS